MTAFVWSMVSYKKAYIKFGNYKLEFLIALLKSKLIAKLNFIKVIVEI